MKNIHNNNNNNSRSGKDNTSKRSFSSISNEKTEVAAKKGEHASSEKADHKNMVEKGRVDESNSGHKKHSHKEEDEDDEY